MQTSILLSMACTGAENHNAKCTQTLPQCQSAAAADIEARCCARKLCWQLLDYLCWGERLTGLVLAGYQRFRNRQSSILGASVHVRLQQLPDKQDHDWLCTQVSSNATHYFCRCSHVQQPRLYLWRCPCAMHQQHTSITKSAILVCNQVLWLWFWCYGRV